MTAPIKHGDWVRLRTGGRPLYVYEVSGDEVCVGIDGAHGVEWLHKSKLTHARGQALSEDDWG